MAWPDAGSIEGTTTVVIGAQAGRPSWLAGEWSMRLPDELGEQMRDAEDHGRTAVAVGWDGQARGVAGGEIRAERVADVDGAGGVEAKAAHAVEQDERRRLADHEIRRAPVPATG